MRSGANLHCRVDTGGVKRLKILIYICKGTAPYSAAPLMHVKPMRCLWDSGRVYALSGIRWAVDEQKYVRISECGTVNSVKDQPLFITCKNS